MIEYEKDELLIEAVVDGRNVSSITELLESEGISTNARDYHGRTPLHWACYKGHLEIARVLYLSL